MLLCLLCCLRSRWRQQQHLHGSWAGCHTQKARVLNTCIFMIFQCMVAVFLVASHVQVVWCMQWRDLKVAGARFHSSSSCREALCKSCTADYVAWLCVLFAQAEAAAGRCMLCCSMLPEHQCSSGCCAATCLQKDAAPVDATQHCMLAKERPARCARNSYC